METNLHSVNKNNMTQEYMVRIKTHQRKICMGFKELWVRSLILASLKTDLNGRGKWDPLNCPVYSQRDYLRSYQALLVLYTINNH